MINQPEDMSQDEAYKLTLETARQIIEINKSYEKTENEHSVEQLAQMDNESIIEFAKDYAEYNEDVFLSMLIDELAQRIRY